MTESLWGPQKYVMSKWGHKTKTGANPKIRQARVGNLEQGCQTPSMQTTLSPQPTDFWPTAICL